MENKLNNIRHSCSHLMAAAVKELYPMALPTIGPVIENGFYYDFDFDKEKISDQDLPKIEKKMREILPNWKTFEKIEIDSKEAKKIYKDNPYKLELIKDLEEKKEKITFYESGKFLDLCRGGHSENPNKELKNFKLLSIAGAYWKGNEKNKMLTRIYGTCFETKEELEKYLSQIEEAKKRDHRKIGKELDLFSFSDLVGGGLPLYTPKGTILRTLINGYVEEVQSKQGYQQVWTPQITKAELFKTSGHYSKYKNDMFKVISNYSKEEFYLKPMNCPQHTQIYSSKARSYKDLPLRFTDFAMLYRDEKPGELSGLARVRSFSQDDCHVFCMESQVDEEADRALSMIRQIMNTYGFKYRYRLSTRDLQHPEKYLGDPKTWNKIENWSVKIMQRNKIEYYDGPGEAAFYAPKMDLMATDSLGREWQLSTLQIDFFLPQRFNLLYTDKDGKEKRPVMLHRAILGSSERFLMILIEHYAGNFPTWLSPVQVSILPISEKFISYAKDVENELISNNIRVELNENDETLGAKIRKAQMEKIPYMIIVGEKEEKDKKIAVRTREGKDLGQVDIIKFIKDLRLEIDEKRVNK